MTQAIWSRRRRRWAAALAVCAALGGALGAPLGAAEEEEEDTSAFQLTEAEKLLAVQLTDQAITSRDLRNGSPLYLVETELVVEKAEVEGAPGKRLARITHYRYDGDLSIFTLIDVSAQSARRMDVVPHHPVPFSNEEYEAAAGLALADRRVRSLLGERLTQVQVEGLALRTSDPADRYFGHRVLRLMFKLGHDYLTRPIAVVDLTAQTVVVDDFAAGKAVHQ
jgi:hypothetical protein